MSDGITPTSIGLALLRQDVGHAGKIKEHEAKHKADELRIAKLEGALRLAVPVLKGGAKKERLAVAAQINELLAQNQEAY